MAPRVLKDVLERFPALSHLDGTARHQSVGPLSAAGSSFGAPCRPHDRC